MTETVSGGGEFVEHGRVEVLVVVLAEAVLERQEAELLHLVAAQDDGQELVVGDVLHLADEDPPRLLVQPLVVPVRVDVGQLGHEPVVLAQEDGVRDGQAGLLAVTRITCLLFA